MNNFYLNFNLKNYKRESDKLMPISMNRIVSSKEGSFKAIGIDNGKLKKKN